MLGGALTRLTGIAEALELRIPIISAENIILVTCTSPLGGL
jgi:hypothetical protein